MSKASRILSIDPGPQESAWVWLVGGVPKKHGEGPNRYVQSICEEPQCIVGSSEFSVAIEDFIPYGQKFGWSTRDTIMWIGRFDYHCTAHLIPRPDIRLHLCGQKSGVGDPDIRQALIRRFGPSKREAIGLKASPGPLYGFKSHLWSALAVGITYYDKTREEV